MAAWCSAGRISMPISAAYSCDDEVGRCEHTIESMRSRPRGLDVSAISNLVTTTQTTVDGDCDSILMDLLAATEIDSAFCLEVVRTVSVRTAARSELRDAAKQFAIRFECIGAAQVLPRNERRGVARIESDFHFAHRS